MGAIPRTFPDHLEAHLGPACEARWASEDLTPPSLSVVSFENQPAPGAVTYITLGLSRMLLHQAAQPRRAGRAVGGWARRSAEAPEIVLNRRLASLLADRSQEWLSVSGCFRSARMPGSQRRFVDERFAKALSHPLRPRILQRLDEAEVASPSELAEALGERLPNVSYHVGILRELGLVQLVRTEPRRGALEHFYRATVRPWLDDEQWAALPRGFRARTLGRSLTEILEQAASASQEGGFDGPETHASHVVLALDAAGMTEVRALLTATLEAARQVAVKSASRQEERGRNAPPTIATQLA